MGKEKMALTNTAHVSEEDIRRFRRWL